MFFGIRLMSFPLLKLRVICHHYTHIGKERGVCTKEKITCKIERQHIYTRKIHTHTDTKRASEKKKKNSAHTHGSKRLNINREDSWLLSWSGIDSEGEGSV